MHIGGLYFADTEVQFPIEEIQPSYVELQVEGRWFSVFRYTNSSC